MNSKITVSKAPRVVLMLLMIIANAVICFNMSLCGDLIFYFGFLLIGIAASSWLSAFNGLTALIISEIIGAAISFILTPTAISVITSLSAIPFAFTMRYVIKGKLKRSSAIATSSALLTLSLCAFFSAYTVHISGKLSPESIISTFPGFFDELTEVICSSSYIEVAGELVQGITPEGAVIYLNTMIGIIPAVIFLILSIVGYLGAWILKKLINVTTGLTPSEDVWKLSTALPTTVIFILALVVTSLSSTVNPLSLAAMNLCILIFPVLFMTGLNSAFEPKIVNGYKFPRILRPAILFILLLNNFFYFSAACALFALYDSIKSVIPKRKSEE